MTLASSQAINILIVEDNRIDARLISHALQRIEDWTLNITVIDDGEKAIQYLLDQIGMPDLVLLDLNLPKRDGTEVLRALRNNQVLQNRPVFILSSTPVEISEAEVRQADLQADAYFAKPFELGTFAQIASSIFKTFSAVHQSGIGSFSRQAAM